MLCSAETDDDAVPGGGAAVLAVFPEGSSEPQDVAEVKSDVLCFLGEQPLLAIGPDDSFTVVNHHFNSNQSYLDTARYHVHGGRLRLVDAVFTLSVQGVCDQSFREVTNVADRTGSPVALPESGGHGHPDHRAERGRSQGLSEKQMGKPKAGVLGNLPLGQGQGPVRVRRQRLGGCR